MKYQILVVLLLLFAANTAAGEPVSYSSGICKFNLYNYQLAPHIERAIVFGTSRIVDTYRDTFGFSYPDGFEVKITIFDNQDEFIEYQKKQHPGSIVSKTGYYSGRYHEAVVWKNKDPKTMVGVVFHEANHLILGYHIPWSPNWVNEGLSEYFEGLNVFGENRRVFLQQNRAKWCKHWLKKGFPMEPDKYLSLNHNQWLNFKNKNSNAAYTIGYSLVYFLMSRSNTEEVLKELLWDFKKNGKDANSIQTINNFYPGGVKKLQRQWLKWIPRARPYRPLRALRKQAKQAKKEQDTNSPLSKD